MGGRRVCPAAFPADQPLQIAALRAFIGLGGADGDTLAGLGSGESVVNKTDVEVHGLVARQTLKRDVLGGKRQAGLGGRHLILRRPIV